MSTKNIKTSIKKKLQEDVSPSPVNAPITPRFGWDNNKYQELEIPIHEVMSAYQNANKWLDTIKEHILINLHCPYFSNIVHQLAHTMPGRFDVFGDILHTENLEIPYPATEEWTESLGDIRNCINIIYDILGRIQEALFLFKRSAEASGLPSMSIACDPLVTDISNVYTFYHRAVDMLESYPTNLAAWDKNIYMYYENQSKLI